MTLPPVTTGLLLCLQADSITGVSDGGVVPTTWSDSSTAGHDATRVGYPTWRNSGTHLTPTGKPSVNFTEDGYHYFTLPSGMFVDTTSAEAFIVLKTDSATSDHPGPWYLRGGELSFYSAGSSYSNHVYDGSFTTDRYNFLPSVSITSWQIYNISHDGTTWVARLADAVQYTTTVGYAAPDRAALGRASGGTNYDVNVNRSWQGNVAELLLYDHSLDSTDRTSVYDYLYSRYIDTSGGTTPVSKTQAVAWETESDIACSNNDNFDCAYVVEITDASIPYVSDPVDNTSYTRETGEPYYEGDTTTTGRTAWWKYTPTEDGTATIDTLATTGTSPDTVLGIYTGESVDALTVIAANDDAGFGGNLTSIVTLGVIADTTYYIQVGNLTPTDIYNYVLKVEGPISALPPPPELTPVDVDYSVEWSVEHGYADLVLWPAVGSSIAVMDVDFALPNPNDFTVNKTFTSGTVNYVSSHGSSAVTIQLIVTTLGGLHISYLYDVIKRWFMPHRRPTLLYKYKNDPVERFMDLVPNALGAPMPVAQGNTYTIMTCGWVNPNGVAYARDVQQMYIPLSSDSPTDVITRGTDVAYPIYQIRALDTQLTNPILYNRTLDTSETGARIGLTGVLQAGEFIELDSSTQTVKYAGSDSSAADRSSWLTTHAWFGLHPFVNSLELNSDGVDDNGEVLIVYRDTYLGG